MAATAELAPKDEVDALLADADAVLNEFQADLGKAGQTSGESSEASAKTQSAAEAIPAVEPVMAAPSGDAQAQVEAAQPEQSNSPPEPADASANSSVPVSGPNTAPSEWVEEAKRDGSLSHDRLPDISEAAVSGGDDSDGPDEAVEAEPHRRRRGPLWLVRAILHLPIDLLAILDLPFSSMSLEAKSYVGYAAIATLMMAGFITVARDQLRPKRDYPEPPAIAAPVMPEQAEEAEGSAEKPAKHGE